MQKQSLVLLACLLCFGRVAWAQQAPTRAGQASSPLIRVEGTESTLGKTSLFQKYYHLQKSDALKTLRTEQDALGFTHEKHQQFYKGLPVEGATVTVHSKGGKVETLSGNYLAVGELNATPAITAKAAFQAALAHVGAKHYRWEAPLGEHNDYIKPKGTLVVLADFDGREAPRLAYKFDIYASEPLYRADVFIDAHTGKYIRENKRIHEANVPATGTSLYNGSVSFTADAFNGSYRLRQTSSGNGVQTFDLHNSSSLGAATDFTSAGANFTADPAGVQAHWCAEKVHSFYLSTFNRNSYDNAGAVLKSYVHYQNNLVNAYWTGSEMLYGDGGGGITPLVTLDICGHEITHAVTEYSANLVYANEPGALNESFSDIFGECVENFGAGANDWLCGSQIGITIRSFSDPNSEGQPDTYKGDMWDNGQEVHTNSGVQNKWFYILSVGETGNNDNGDHYCVTGIGINAAAAIAYRNLTVYLSAGSNYAAARTGAIQAAIDLFGPNSPEVVATTNAWRAVGVGAAFVPKITCPASVVVNNTTNQCAAVVNYTAPVGLANCPTVTQTAGLVSGSTFPVGITTNTFRVTDAASATATCTFTVRVIDAQAPSITCPANVTVTAGANCQAVLASYTGSASATDNCTAPTVTQLPVAGTTINGGVTMVTLRATDAGLLSSTCILTVTINDVTPPSITCPANVTVVANSSCQASLVNYTASASATDNCAAPTVTQLPAAGTTISGGTTSVTLRATDGSGLSTSCTMTVSVADQTPPTVTCPANVTVAAGETCTASLASYLASASAADNCSTPTKTQLPTAGTSVGLGATTVTMRATDGAGLSATCTFTVTVTDQTAPTVVCKTVNVPLTAAGTASIVTADVFQSATDNCGTINQVSVVPGTFNCGNLGLNTVVLTVNDGHGNTGTCTTQVTVSDPIAPSMFCKNVAVSLNAAGTATVTAAQVNNGSTDNCTLTSLTLSPTTFTCANLGANTVTLTGKDQSANQSTCTATVTVTDPILPVALCKSATLQLNANGSVAVTGATVNNGSSDNCSFSLSVTPATLTCANVGLNNTVTLKVTDASGNTATCTALVTVQDNVAPTAICKNITIFVDNDGQASITAADVNNGSFDPCGIGSMSINLSQFNCSDLPGSAKVVKLFVKDIYNNQSTCLSNVSVKDNIAPTAICQNVTVKLNQQGNVTVYPFNLAADSYDNCSVWSYAPTAKVYTAANIGVNNLTVTVKDWSNNATTCVSQVTVQPYNSAQGEIENRDAVPQDGTPGSFELQVFPNPTAGDANLVFQLPVAQPVVLHLFDTNGRLVLNQPVDGTTGENRVSLELGSLSSGLYLVELNAQGWRGQKRFVLQRN